MATYRVVTLSGGRILKSKGVQAESPELLAGLALTVLATGEELVRIERKDGRRWIDCNVMPATKE